MPRKIFECEQDGPSVVLWEAGKGTRVTYQSEDAAERVCSYLINKANQFHAAKEANDGSEDNLMVTIDCFGERMTEFQFVRHFISVVKSAGFGLDDTLRREALEFW